MEFLETLSNPYYLVALLVLTCVSSFFAWVGFKEKNIPAFLIGVGAGIPTFAIDQWKTWVAGALICAVGVYLRSKLNSPV